MDEKTPVSRKQVERVAEVIKQMLFHVDLFDSMFEADVAEEALQTMKRERARLEALPFPATLNKAAELGRQIKLFEAVIELFRVRREQAENAGRKPFIDDEELRRLGIL